MHLHLQCSDIKVQNLTLLQQAFNYYTCTIKYILITCCVGYDRFDLPSVGLYVICSWEFLALLNLVFWLFNEYVNWYNFLEIATMNFVKLRWYKGHNFTRIFWFHYFSGISTLLNLEFNPYIKFKCQLNSSEALDVSRTMFRCAYYQDMLIPSLFWKFQSFYSKKYISQYWNNLSAQLLLNHRMQFLDVQIIKICWFQYFSGNFGPFIARSLFSTDTIC